MPNSNAVLLDRRIVRAMVTDVRSEVRREAVACGLHGQRLEDFLLAVTEIAGNAVLHGGGSASLRLWWSRDTLVCEISDSGPGLAADRVATHPPDPLAIGGRGLWLARTLTDTLEISSRADGGTVVRLEISCIDSR